MSWHAPLNHPSVVCVFVAQPGPKVPACWCSASCCAASGWQSKSPGPSPPSAGANLPVGCIHWRCWMRHCTHLFCCCCYWPELEPVPSLADEKTAWHCQVAALADQKPLAQLQTLSRHTCSQCSTIVNIFDGNVPVILHTAATLFAKTESLQSWPCKKKKK